MFEFDCAADTFELGDLIGVDDNAAADALMDQQVIKVTDPARAIGRAAKRYGSNTTSVLVDVRSGVMYGGVQGSTASGA